jgi:hypothetical protein
MMMINLRKIFSTGSMKMMQVDSSMVCMGTLCTLISTIIELSLGN